MVHIYCHPFSRLSHHRVTGDQCMYRHALPPGFVLKSQKKAAEEAAKANTISLEEFLEVEVRKLLGAGFLLTITHQ